MTHEDISLEGRTAEVKVSVLERNLVADIVVVLYFKGRRLCGGEYLHAFNINFNLACGNILVYRTLSS